MRIFVDGHPAKRDLRSGSGQKIVGERAGIRRVKFQRKMTAVHRHIKILSCRQIDLSGFDGFLVKKMLCGHGFGFVLEYAHGACRRQMRRAALLMIP
jgi:hypothetical protein